MTHTLLMLVPVVVDRATTTNPDALRRAVRRYEEALRGVVLAAGVRAGTPASVVLPWSTADLLRALGLAADALAGLAAGSDEVITLDDEAPDLSPVLEPTP